MNINNKQDLLDFLKSTTDGYYIRNSINPDVMGDKEIFEVYGISSKDEPKEVTVNLEDGVYVITLLPWEKMKDGIKHGFPWLIEFTYYCEYTDSKRSKEKVYPLFHDNRFFTECYGSWMEMFEDLVEEQHALIQKIMYNNFVVSKAEMMEYCQNGIFLLLCATQLKDNGKIDFDKVYYSKLLDLPKNSMLSHILETYRLLYERFKNHL